MKTILVTILLCTCQSFLFAQLQIVENDAKELKNSLTIDYSSNSGVGISYDRELFKKGKYALVGQVGTSGNVFFRRLNGVRGNVNFTAALKNRFTFGEHSVEAGIGMRTGNIFIANLNDEIPGVNEWTNSPFLNLGYLYQPKGKNWFLRANLNFVPSAYTRRSTNLSVGFGFKF